MGAYCGGLILLASLTKQDLKEKRVSVNKILFFAILAVIYLFFSKNLIWQELCGRIFPGMLLLTLSLLSREGIGYGDGAVVMVLGLWIGMKYTLMVVCVGIFAAGIYSLFCLIRKSRSPFPFIPFLLLGMEVVLIVV